MNRPLFRLQYDLDPLHPYTEVGSNSGAKIDLATVADEDVRLVLTTMTVMDYRSTMKWLNHLPDEGKIQVFPLTTRTPEVVNYRLSKRNPALLLITRPLHTVEQLDDYLYAVSRGVDEGCYVWCHTMTSVLKRDLIKHQYHKLVSPFVLLGNYLWHRVAPKLRLTHDFYFTVTKGKNRMMGRPEVIGRLYRAGFELVDERFCDGELFLLTRKVKPPVDDTPPSGSPIIHLRRVGKDGKEIVVHKFRTMYTYSEYVQPYIYHYHNLDRGGKFRDDYRVTAWGRWLRRLWIDEIPMLWNLLRGDIKLVGVRPLSRQYFNLYRPEVQQLRIKTKPGLLPPFYYERRTPETLDEVQQSELNYLHAYLEHPFRTDWHYFWGIVGNILFRRRRSQ